MANAKKLWEKGQTKQKTTPAASSGPAASAVDNIVKNTQTAAAGQQRVSQSAVDQMLADVQKSQYATVSEVIRAGQKPVTARPTQQSKITAGRESTTPLQKQTGSASIKDRLARMSQVSRIGKDSTANKPLPTMTAGGALAGITTQVRPAASDTVRKLNSLAADIRSNESDLINMNRRLSALKAKANRGDASAVDSYNQLADRYNQKFESYVANIGIYNTLYRGEYRDQGIRDSYARREYQEYRRQNRDAGVRQAYKQRRLEEELSAPRQIDIGKEGTRTIEHTPTRAEQAVGGALSYYGSGFAQAGGLIAKDLFREDGGQGHSATENVFNVGKSTEVAAAARAWDKVKAGGRDWADGLMKAGHELDERGEIQVKLAKQGLGTVGQALVDLGVVAIQMAGDIGLAVATGGSMLVPMGLRSYGNGYLTAEQMGYSGGEAELYGLGVAAVEVLSEKMFSVFSIAERYAKGVVKQEMSERVINAVVTRMAKSTTGRTALNRLMTLLFSAGSEGLEEVMAGIMEPVIRKATLDHSINVKQEIDWENALYEGLIGGILGGLGGAVDLRNTRATHWKYYKQGINENIERFDEAARKYGLDSKEAQQAAKAVWDGGTRKMNEVAGFIVGANENGEGGRYVPLNQATMDDADNGLAVTYHQLAAAEEATRYGRTDAEGNQVQGPSIADSLYLGKYLKNEEKIRRQEAARREEAARLEAEEKARVDAEKTAQSARDVGTSAQGELTETSRGITPNEDGTVRLDTARSAQTRAQAPQGVADLSGIPEDQLTQEERDELQYGIGAVEDLGRYTGLAQRMGQAGSVAPGQAGPVAAPRPRGLLRSLRTPGVQQQAASLQQRVGGLRVAYTPMPKNMPGYVDRSTGTIYLNSNVSKDKLLRSTLGHELVHYLKKQDPQLIGDIIAYMEQIGEDVQGEIARLRPVYEESIRKIYAANPAKMQQKLAELDEPGYFEEEVAANFIGRICEEQSETLDRLAAEEPGLLQRIVETLRRFLRELGTTPEGQERIQVYEQAIARMNAALAKAGQGTETGLEDTKHLFTEIESDAAPDELAPDELPAELVSNLEFDNDVRFNLRSMDQDLQALDVLLKDAPMLNAVEKAGEENGEDVRHRFLPEEEESGEQSEAGKTTQQADLQSTIQKLTEQVARLTDRLDGKTTEATEAVAAGREKESAVDRDGESRVAGSEEEEEDIRFRISQIVDEAIGNKGNLGTPFNQKRISPVPQWLADMVSASSGGKIDISGKYIAIEGGLVYHEYKNRSDDQVETSRDQILMEADDFKKALSAIYHPDYIESIFTDTNNPGQRQSFAYAKKDNGYYIVVEVVGGKHNPNIVPTEILHITENKWNNHIGAGKSIGEMVHENKPAFIQAIPDARLNKKNRVIVAKGKSPAVGGPVSPHSPRSNNSITPASGKSNTSPALNPPTASTMDEEYLAAVKAGDMDTAQRMVDEAAQAAGYTMKVYHGSSRRSKSRSRGEVKGAEARALETIYADKVLPFTVVLTENALSRGFYTATNQDVADVFTLNWDYDSGRTYSNVVRDGTLYALYARPDEALRIDAGGSNWEHVPTEALPADVYKNIQELLESNEHSGDVLSQFKDGTVALEWVVGAARDLGYNAVIADNLYESILSPEVGDPSTTDVVVFASDQVKSADPVTYDDDGNVIPLSERFRTDRTGEEEWKNDDIRFSVAEEGEETGEQKAPAEMTAEKLQALAVKAKAAERHAQKVMRQMKLTDKEQGLVNSLLKGALTLDEMRSTRYESAVDKQAVQAVYQARQAYRDAQAPVEEYNRQHREGLNEEARTLTENSFDWKSPNKEILLDRETPRRVFYGITKSAAEAEALNSTYVDPIREHEAQKNRMIKRYQERIAKLKIDKKKRAGNKVSEAYAVQYVGELEFIRDWLEQLPEGETRGGLTYAEAKTLLTEFWEQNPNLDQDRIHACVEEFRAIYDELFAMINEARVRNGYRPIDYRKGYFPHFTSKSADTIVQALSNGLGFGVEVTELPTDIAGLTYLFKPGIQWSGHMLQRTGNDTDYNVLEGWDRYIPAVANIIYHTDDIQRWRALERTLRYKHGTAGVREKLAAIRDNKDMTEEERDEEYSKLLDESGKADVTHLGAFVQWIGEYTNYLAGKRYLWDRLVEAKLNRKFYSRVQWLENRVAANMLAGNISSAMTNFIPLFQAMGNVRSSSMLRAIGEYALGQVHNRKQAAAWRNGSNFLVNRKGYDPLYNNAFGKVKNALFVPFNIVDDFTSEVIVRARYYDELKNGASPAEAMALADIFAGEVMADRTVGELPVVFNSKTLKVLTMFQVEVNNDLSHFFKDIPRDAKRKGSAAWLALLRSMIRYCIAVFLYNDLFEAIWGRRVAFDPLSMVEDVVADLTGKELPNGFELIAEWVRTKEAPDWDKVFDSNKGEQPISELFADIKAWGENVPFLSGMMGGGRYPVFAFLPNFGELGSGVNTIWDLAVAHENAPEYDWQQLYKRNRNLLAYMAPPAFGGQIRRTVEGVLAARKEGSYTVNREGERKLQYPILSTYDKIKAAIFGKSSTKGGREWTESGFDTLYTAETQAYLDLVAGGSDPQFIYDIIQDLGGDGRTGVEKAYALAASNLKNEERIRLLDLFVSESQSEKFAAMMTDGGLTFRQCAEVYEQYKALEKIESLKPMEQAIQFETWLDREGYTDDQKAAITEQYKYYNQSAAEPKNYKYLVNAGLTIEKATELATDYAELEKLPGESQVTTNQKMGAVAAAGYLSESDKQTAMRLLHDSKKNSDGISQQDKYKQYITDYQIPVEVYYQYCTLSNGIKGDDKDGDGNTDQYSKCDKLFAIINRLPLQAGQKTSLAIFKCGVSEKTVYSRAPWL